MEHFFRLILISEAKKIWAMFPLSGADRGSFLVWLNISFFNYRPTSPFPMSAGFNE